MEPEVEYDPRVDVGVSFQKVAEAAFFRQEKFNPDASARAWYSLAHRPRYEAFEKEYGLVTQQYYCSNLVAAVVLTDNHRVFGGLQRRRRGRGADRGRHERRRQPCRRCAAAPRGGRPGAPDAMEMVYTACSSALALLDTTQELDAEARRRARGVGGPGLENVLSLLAGARAYFEQVARRTAEIHYFQGMIIAGLVILVLGLIAAALIAVALPSGA